MKGTSKRGLGYRHLILLMVWLLYLINYMDRTSVLTFLPYIGKDLHLSAAQLGWLGSIFFAGYALAQVSAGFVADKFGPKKTMNIAIWMFTCVTFLTGLVRSFGQFIALRFFLAIGISWPGTADYNDRLPGVRSGHVFPQPGAYRAKCAPFALSRVGGIFRNSCRAAP